MYDEKISVILPIYGVEKFLDECIQTVVNQSYKNLEIILVDDGSTDNCPRICDKWVEKDSRIKAIHKTNGGLSDARNAGMNVATGEYFIFVDSDDLVHPQMIEILYSMAKKQDADMVGCCFKEFTDGQKISYPMYGEDIRWKKYSANEAMIESCTNSDIHNCFIVAWNRIYRRSLFNHIQYPFGKIHEDAFVAFQLLEAASGMVLVEPQLYYYRQRPGSIKNSAFSVKEIDTLYSFEMRISNAEEYGVTKCCRMLIVPYLQYCLRYLGTIDNKGNKEICTELKQIYKNAFIKYRKYLNTKSKVKFAVALLKIEISLH